jgi:hypothetical protein
MPMHDWTRVDASIFNAYHHGWISTLSDALNATVLPKDFYALPARLGAGLQHRERSCIVVHHESDDRIVAMIEIVLPRNKANRQSLDAFVDKACARLEHRIHLLIIDAFPPTPRDPHGVHAAIWQETDEDSFELPPDKPLTLVAYACDDTTRAYVEPFAVGDVLPHMPLFLQPQAYVNVPLEATYQTAHSFLPRRWQRVLD